MSLNLNQNRKEFIRNLSLMLEQLPFPEVSLQHAVPVPGSKMKTGTGNLPLGKRLGYTNSD